MSAAKGVQVEERRAEANYALVRGSLHSQRRDQYLACRTGGLPTGMVQVAKGSTASWPTGLVLTVERYIIGGEPVAVGAGVTITAFGATDVPDIGFADELRVRVSTPSSAGHGRVKVGITCGRD